ncbi:MAG: AMP-dependent synthetase/ligase [Candidatus Sericytochromatia bacterium]
MAFENLTQVLAYQASRQPDKPLWRFCRAGAWRDVTYGEAMDRVRAVAQGLAAVGVAPGDRVAVMADNGPEWALADWGIIAAGGVSVSVYPGLPAEEAAWVVGHAGAKAAFAGNPAMAETLLAQRGAMPDLATIVLLGGELDHPDVLSVGDLERLGPVGDGGLPGGLSRHETPLTIIYTSGTTGVPKGVVLTHGNLLDTIAAVEAHVGDLGRFDLNLSVLPLSHVFERAAGHFFPLYMGNTIAYARGFDTLGEDFQAIRPTFVVAVPRMLEKIHARVTAQVAASPWHRRRVFDWALGVGERYSRAREAGEPVHLNLALEHVIADRAVFAPIRSRLGGRLQVIVSGGAPLSGEIARFFHAMGILVCEGWGATETSAPATINVPDAFRFGSVGKPLPGVTIKLAEDGELLVRGPNVFQGYYRDEAATAEAIDAEGFFHTGDIGERDSDGFWRITDRKKELIITAGGKNIAPQKLENALKARPGIASACVVGDRRPYLTALLTIDREALAAHHPRLAGRPVDDADLRAAIAAEVTDVNVRLARVEQIKDFRLLDTDFSAESGELTYTLKLKRRVIEARHAALIAAMYAHHPV